MTPREIIAEAWTLTTTVQPLRRWGFVAALFETMRSVEMILYQAYYLYWYMQGKTVGWWSVEVMLFEKLAFWLSVAITIFILVLFVFQLFVPTLATGAVIGLAAKAYKKEEVKGGLVLALYNFFPLLEIHGMFILSNFTAVLTVCSIIIRYGGAYELKVTAITFLILFWLIAVLFRFFSSFAEEGVVIRRVGVFTAVGKSFKLIISYLSHVMFLLILLFVISIRIFINAIMVLLLPAFAISLGFVLALFLPTFLSYMIATGVGIALLFLLSYFLAYLHVFKQTVWTLTYMVLSSKKDLDVIES